MASAPRADHEQSLFTDAESSKIIKKNVRRYTIASLSVCLVLALSLLLCLGVKHFWKQTPEKIYDVEYKVVRRGERPATVLMEIDSLNKTETFWTSNGTDEVVEIHDFKRGLTGIFLVGLQKCFIKTQSKDLPEVSSDETEQLEEGDTITETYHEQSMVWVPVDEPVEDKEFLRNSKIFDVCKNVPVHWIHPAFPTAPEFVDFEEGAEAGDETPSKETKEQQVSGVKRQARSLTEEDLPINDYREVGLELDPMYDHRGFCCTHCRRGQRYCQRVCEPLLGYYPYPYCYGGGRVICRIIMPCNWWVARMLGRV
ncbi:tenomodulin [Ambystoma mexicanum]|uniref:tenomodulin n=1 Tax=Ambystoma mexicanum TaxID=8296 RepID=UPI0037E7C6F9